MCLLMIQHKGWGRHRQRFIVRLRRWPFNQKSPPVCSVLIQPVPGLGAVAAFIGPPQTQCSPVRTGFTGFPVETAARHGPCKQPE